MIASQNFNINNKSTREYYQASLDCTYTVYNVYILIYHRLLTASGRKLILHYNAKSAGLYTTTSI